MEEKDVLLIYKFVESLSEEQSNQFSRIIKTLKNNEVATLRVLLELLRKKYYIKKRLING